MILFAIGERLGFHAEGEGKGEGGVGERIEFQTKAAPRAAPPTSNGILYEEIKFDELGLDDAMEESEGVCGLAKSTSGKSPCSPGELSTMANAELELENGSAALVLDLSLAPSRGLQQLEKGVTPPCPCPLPLLTCLALAEPSHRQIAAILQVAQIIGAHPFSVVVNTAILRITRLFRDGYFLPSLIFSHVVDRASCKRRSLPPSPPRSSFLISISLRMLLKQPDQFSSCTHQQNHVRSFPSSPPPFVLCLFL